MKLENLSTETLDKIKSVRWDRIIEKHEGPEDWESVLRYYEPDFYVRSTPRFGELWNRT
jgi:hypothetical protein